VLLLIAAVARDQRSAIIAAALFTAVDDDLQKMALGRRRVVHTQLCAAAGDFLGSRSSEFLRSIRLVSLSVCVDLECLGPQRGTCLYMNRVGRTRIWEEKAF
jgi:hypothetical protein